MGLKNGITSVLLEADGLVNGPRSKDYGSIRGNMEVVSKLFHTLTNVVLSVEHLTLLMVCFKLARESNKHKRDNVVDACGYLELYSRLVEGVE